MLTEACSEAADGEQKQAKPQEIYKALRLSY